MPSCNLHHEPERCPDNARERPHVTAAYPSSSIHSLGIAAGITSRVPRSGNRRQAMELIGDAAVVTAASRLFISLTAGAGTRCSGKNKKRRYQPDLTNGYKRFPLPFPVHR